MQRGTGDRVVAVSGSSEEACPAGTSAAWLPRRWRWAVFLYVTLLGLMFAQATYTYYAQEYVWLPPQTARAAYYAEHNRTPLALDHPFFQGKDHAPDQYRVGVAMPLGSLARLIGTQRVYIFYPIVDFFCGVGACLLLLNLLMGSGAFRRMRASVQPCALAAFLACLPFAYFWVVPFQRPETMPSALILAACLNLLGRLKTGWHVAALLFLAVWQTFIRADVVVVFGAAVAVLGVLRKLNPGVSRVAGLALGTCMVVAALGTSALLKFYIFPHATYAPDTPVVTIGNNLQARVFSHFLLAVAPLVLLVREAFRKPAWLESSDLIAILAACFYIPLWFTVGILWEVRIFVPFLFLLTPTAAKLIATTIGGGADDTKRLHTSG